MDPAPPPRWGAPPPHASARPLPTDPLPARARFEPSVLLTSPAEVRHLRSSLRGRVQQAAPERQRRLAELAAISEGFAVLRVRELDRALRRLAAPASGARGHGAWVLALGDDGPALAAERADALAIASWSDVVSIEVGTVAHGARRVRAVVLSVQEPPRQRPPSADAGFRRLAADAARASAAALAARRRRAVLVPLVVAAPGPLGWTVADDRSFLLALDRLRHAHERSAS